MTPLLEPNQSRTLAERRAYEAAHKKDETPMQGTRHLYGDTAEDLACSTCEDTGEYNTPSGTAMPCPDCDAGNWNNILETWDDARRGK